MCTFCSHIDILRDRPGCTVRVMDVLRDDIRLKRVTVRAPETHRLCVKMMSCLCAFFRFTLCAGLFMTDY